MAEYIDKAQVQTELMMNAERYTIAHESGGFGTVEWSDNLIPVSRAMEIIRNIPSLEDVPVIRCKDCRYYKDNECTNTFWGMCERDYCSEGERRTDG